jgi:hypothetical protein
MPTRRRSGPAITEATHAERGWTRLSLRLPPAESTALAALTLPGELPGLAVRRVILEALSRGRKKSSKPSK